MSSQSFKGSEISRLAKMKTPQKLTRSQTAKQALRAIKSKYDGVIVPSARYYHRGNGNWIKYSPTIDKKQTSSKVKTTKPKNYTANAHKYDVRGLDTKKAGAKARATKVAAKKTKRITKTMPTNKKTTSKIVSITIPQPTPTRKYAGFLIEGDTYTARRDIKAMGGKWNANLTAWVVPSNKANAKTIGMMKKQRKIKVSAYKTDVNPFKRLNAAEKLAIRESKLLKKAERYESKASKQTAESKSRYESAHRAASAIPFGQPILVGHHSEGRDRRYRAKIQADYGKSFAAAKEAEKAATKAADTRQFTSSYVSGGGSPTIIKGRIKKAEAELKKMENQIKKMEINIKHMSAVVGKQPYTEAEIKRYKANIESAKRRIPDIKNDITSLKALLPKGSEKAAIGVTMKEFSGTRLKKALGVSSANKQYHNKNLRGGNFGIMLRTDKTWYDITGQHDPDGVIRTLSIINTQTTKGYFPTPISTSTFATAISEIKKYIKTAESKL